MEKFLPLFELSDEALSRHNARWITVDFHPGYPCRVSLTDARVGEKVLGLSFYHHDVSSPYRASGPIFVRENAVMAKPEIGEIPALLRHRSLSARGYDQDHMMIDARVTNGAELESILEQLFRNKCVDYIHIHNADPGCFMCKVSRVS
jgi:hypothetical protein